MTTSKPELPWYQFSLRSLLLLTFCIAVLCSLGVCMNWSIAAIIAVGGVAGSIVARSWLGLVLGGVAGSTGSVVAVIAASFRGLLIFDPIMADVHAWPFLATATIGSAIGGVLGGILGRAISQQ